MPAATDAAAIARRLDALYASAAPKTRLLARLRPYICPFERLVPLVPARARVLDLGCGTGLLLGLLAHAGRIAEGVGIDADGAAIAQAERMRARLPLGSPPLRFLRQGAEQPWPSGATLISCIDLLHHLPPAAQLPLIGRIATALPPGGWLLYKDMAHRPATAAWGNRLHDLLLARDWIHYRPLAEVEREAQAQGLRVHARGRDQRGWYHHEWLLCERPA